VRSAGLKLWFGKSCAGTYFQPTFFGPMVASRRVVGIEHAILGGNQSEGVSSLTDASPLSTSW
jgi:hypothetical protein